MNRNLIAIVATACFALPALSQEDAPGSSVPLSTAWNIASSGKAASSGELLFRVTPGNGDDPVEVTVFVLSGANETGVASSIRRALSAQLDDGQFNIASGEGANVLVTGARQDDNFAVELVDSDVENVRVMVQSATPVAPPTVPPQSVPANPATTPATPAAPGNAAPPPDAAPPTPAPPADSSAPASSSAPPAGTPAPSSPNTPGGAGAPASAPPPPGS